MTNIRSGAIGETSGSGDLSGGGNGGGSGSGSPLGLLFHIPLELVADLGPPLMSSTMYGVPLFIELAFTYLEREESTTEGIFRLSGSASAIKAYKKIIDAGGQIEWQPGSDAHNATGLIKLYLRELPEPLLTFKLFDALTVICGLQPEHEQLQIRLLSLCLRSLPRCNYNLLRYILIHLRGLARQEEYTKMGIPNLATLLGPNIAKPVGADTCEDQQEMFTMTSQASLIAGCLLRHCDKLFDGPDAQEEREFCGVASLSFNWEPPEASEDELAFSQGEIVFLREGPPHSSDNRDDWVSVMTIREGDVYYGRLPSSYLEAIHTHRELGEIQSGGVDEHVDVAMDDESGAEKVTCDLEQETDELRHKASAKESSPLAENPMARDDEFFDEPQPSSDQGLLLLPGAPPGKGMFASSQSLDESGDLDLSQRIAQLESQVAMLKVELHEERSQRENLAKIIPMLMQNQDQVLALLHGLHSGGNNSNNNGIQGDGDPQ